MSRSAPTVLVATAAVVVAVIGVAVGAGGWPGAVSGCLAAGDCACEGLREAVVRQPVNAASSLALWIAGIGLVAASGRRSDRVGAAAFGLIVLVAGVGSAAFHASVTEWGGWLDLLGIHLLLGFVAAVDLGVVAGWSSRRVVATTAAAAVVMAPALWWMDNGLGKFTAAGLVVAVAALEWRLQRSGSGGRDRRMLTAALGLAGVGLVVQWLGRGGGALCDPDTVWQPHALWHVVAAAAAVALSRYLFPRTTSADIGAV